MHGSHEKVGLHLIYFFKKKKHCRQICARRRKNWMSLLLYLKNVLHDFPAGELGQKVHAGESIVESTRNLEKEERVEHTEKKRKRRHVTEKEASCRR